VKFPLLSINMPVYNGACYIKESIQSILSQTFSDFELIIIDDGSTDNTVAIIEEFKDSRIRVVYNSKKTGLAHVRNKAILESKGKYIALLDSDDISYPDRFKLQVDFLNRNPSHCLVCGWTDIIDANGNITGQEYFNYSDKEIAAALFFHNCISQSSVMLRKSMLPSVAPYHPAFPPAEDYHLWVRMAKSHPMHIIKKPLIKYRVHSTNTSAIKQEQGNPPEYAILAFQCENLGLFGFSNDELGVQLALVYNCYSNDREFLIKLNTFYQKVIQANRQSKIYLPAVFERMIKKYMRLPLQSYFVRKQYGMNELKDLYGSLLKAAYYLSAVDKAKIILKCIFKYKPKLANFFNVSLFI
jgi:glycosyltransferase involved in cell wall biosynthesis